jgi:hypothetical protein
MEAPFFIRFSVLILFHPGEFRIPDSGLFRICMTGKEFVKVGEIDFDFRRFRKAKPLDWQL